MNSPKEHWSTSSILKIQRASEHIDSLESEIAAWIRSDPPPNEIGLEANDGTVSCRVIRTTQPPARFGVVAGDAINNLNSALDVLIHQFVHAVGRKPGRSKLYFPIDDTRQEFEARALGEIRRASQPAAELLRGFRPYKDGNPLLWAVRHLDNVNKHQVLLPVALGHVGFYHPLGSGHVLVPDRWAPLIEGEILFTLTALAMSFDPKPAIVIAFDVPGDLGRAPMLLLLRQLISMVGHVVESFRALAP